MLNKHNLIIYPSAKKDLDEIFAYIADSLANPKAAIDLANKFHDAFENIRYFPESCPFLELENVKDKTIRKLIVETYIAFYRFKDDEIQLVRVVYGMSNYKDCF